VERAHAATALALSLAVTFVACGDDTALEATSGGDGGGGATSVSSADEASTSARASSGTRTTTGGEGAAGQGGGAGGDGGAPPEPFCGDGNVDDGEACDDANDDRYDGCTTACTIPEPLETAVPFVWEYVEVPGTTCMNGDPAGFGVSLNPDSTDVMIYLEGGGACFNDVCDFSAFSIPFVAPGDGIFNRVDLLNPVFDWNMIYVPYCTGDIHGGDAATTLGGSERQFRGYANVATYLERWVATFAGADRVLVTGISAGGFGAGLDFSQIADAFGADVPGEGPQMILIDDSGPPLGSDVIAPCLQQQFRDVWGLDDTVLAACGADCSDPNDFATGVFAHVATRYPEARIGVFSNGADAIIRAFMGFGWGDGEFDNCEGVATPVPAEVYEEGLLALRDAHEDRASTFYVSRLNPFYNFGQNHTVLRGGAWSTTIIEGVSVETWVGRVIDGEVDHVGP
jgi:cysteine-rich repeat protein